LSNIRSCFSFKANFNALMFEIFGQKFFNGDMFVRSFLLSSLYIESEEGAYTVHYTRPPLPPPATQGILIALKCTQRQRMRVSVLRRRTVNTQMGQLKGQHNEIFLYICPSTFKFDIQFKIL
jgi:hypothetical protein